MKLFKRTVSILLALIMVTGSTSIVEAAEQEERDQTVSLSQCEPKYDMYSCPGYILGVTSGTDTNSFVSCFDNQGSITVDKKDSSKVYLSTGDVIQLKEGGRIVDSKIIVVEGDVTGDGYITTEDGELAFLLSVGTTERAEEYVYAGDLDQNGKTDSKEVLRIIRYVEGMEDTLVGERYRVVFLENGSDVFNMPDPQIVGENEFFVMPESIPFRSGYQFGGWYEDEEGMSGFPFLISTNTNRYAYAHWIKETAYDFSINELYWDDNEIVVEYLASGDCQLNIFILNENDKTIVQEYQQSIIAGDNTDTAHIQIDDELASGNYILQACLVDDDGEWLVNASISYEHTTAYQELLETTIADFEEEQVLNFDEDETNNFAVISEGVTYIREEQLSLEIEQRTNANNDYEYVISCPEEQKELIENKKVVYQNSDGMVAFDTTKSETLPDGRISVPAADQQDIAEYFDYIKVDNTTGATYQQADKVSDDVDDVVVTGDFGNSSLSFTLSVGKYFELKVTYSSLPKLNLKMSYDKKSLFIIDGTITSGGTITYELAVKKEYGSTIGKDENLDVVDKTVNLGYLYYPIAETLGLVSFKAEFLVPVKLSVSAQYKHSFSYTYKQKFTYTPFNGFYTPAPEKTIEPAQDYYQISVEFEVGIEMKGTLCVLPVPKAVKDAAEGNLGSESKKSAPVGALELYLDLKFTFSIILTLSNKDIKSNHMCKVCGDGSIDLKATLSLGVNVNFVEFICKLIDKEAPEKPFVKLKTSGSVKMIDLKFHIKDFYISFVNDKNSIFGGKVTFGWDECPNVSKGVIISATDKDGNILTTSFSSEYHEAEESDVKFYTSDSGENVFLPDGNYTTRGVLDNITYSRDFTIENYLTQDEPKYINVLGYTITGRVINPEIGEGVDGCCIRIMTNEGDIIFANTSGTTDLTGEINGEFIIPVGHTSLYVQVTANDNVIFEQEYTIPNEEGVIDLGVIETDLNPASEFIYSVRDDGTILITLYTGRAEIVQIPSVLEGKKVYGTQDFNSFSRNNYIKQLIYSDGIIYASNSIYLCPNLEYIYIPDSMKIFNSSIGDCDSLPFIHFPSGLEEVGSVYDCDLITEIIFPEKITYINHYHNNVNLEHVLIPNPDATTTPDCFMGCVKLVTAGPYYYGIHKNIEYGWNKTIPSYALSGTPLISVVVASGIEKVLFGAFANSKTLEVVYLPGSLKSLSSGCFGTTVTDVYYGGNTEQADKLGLSSYKNFQNATIHYNYH